MHNYLSQVGESKTPGGKDGRAMIVVDCGYSFSHVVPYFDSQMINYGVKRFVVFFLTLPNRVNIGGKALTNYLKEIISYRHWNVMEETHLINGIKEKLCFVSLNYLHDLHACKSTNSFRREFVLPDYIHDFTGYVKPLSSPISHLNPPESTNKEQVHSFHSITIRYSS